MKNWEILIKDLSMRLPYRPKCIVEGFSKPKELIQITIDGENSLFLLEDKLEVYPSEIKPILISPKSIYNNIEIRNELIKELDDAIMKDINYLNTFDWSGSRRFQWAGQNELDFFLKYGIDIFGLIDKGLAYEKFNKLSNT